MDACYLVLSNGRVFPGKSFGHPACRPSELKAGGVVEQGAGEVVFNTGMTGYHEILTDPSYTGQLVTLTYPHAGNYGDSDEWSEIGPEAPGRCGIKAAGLVVRSLYTGPVPAGRIRLDEFMRRNGVPGITDVDTRALTLHIRDCGSPLGVIVSPGGDPGNRTESEALSKKDLDTTMDYLAGFPSMEGRNLIEGVGTGTREEIDTGGSPHFVLVDCGIKANIIRELRALGCAVTVLPSSADAADIFALKPDAVLYSNGPGDPAVLDHPIAQIRILIGRVPVFGICLGHQLISIALGAKTYKMKFGHHGINHPVRDELTGRVLVTSQNHGFATDERTLPPDVAVWFRNANDGSNEGIYHRSLPVASAQFHPESAPGPTDSRWIFQSFIDRIPDREKKTSTVLPV